ncbi:D-2-hydroxyacid dehydrogenase [Oribacterium sp. WCC10]|uniref:D-2-hydroxyacid dehydrogenase n=1 Tax=Oribacterium sp. WCC10 TaxID=1855343 RepID=UPI0008F223B2|nr:D-2-hydroxyacid dehydrogenase [Oribacterium sp. WCC10]SFG16287.1 Phosphoglycerate dehydrogenase [Oribacterium sp. WCC10]
MKILGGMPFSEEDRKYLESKARGCEIIYKDKELVVEEDVQDIDIILGNVSPEVIAKAPKLKWLQTNSAGVDVYCKDGILREDTLLTSASGAYDTTVSEWMVSVCFMLARKEDLYMRNQVERCWKHEGKVVSIEDSVTLVLGLGSIGKHYAGKMHALGSYVIGVTKHQHSDKPDFVDELTTIEHLDELLPRADYVAMVLPGTEENVHIIDTKRLKLMKDTAFLINAGRGNAVDGKALDEALRNGTIGGAALDVTEPEPLPEKDPLWDAPRCIITPHIAGQFYLKKTFVNIVKITGENLEKYLAGDIAGMRNKVDHKKGY